MELQVAPPRYGFIDAIRGVAACCVMFQHALYQSGLIGDWPKATLTGFIPTWLELGETGVVAFFIVSGFVIPLSLEKTADFRLFWLHRALRIYPLYIAVYIVSIALNAGGGLHSLHAFILNAASHALFIQEYTKQQNFVGGSWTLSLELAWYIIISGLFLLSLNKNTTLIVCAGVLVSLAADVACALDHHFPMGRTSMIVCCILGLACYRYQQRQLNQKYFILLLFVLVGTIATNLFVGDYLFPSPHPTSTFAMAGDSWTLAAFVFFVPFLTRRSALWDHRSVQFLGRISYSVYLTHGIILYLISKTPLKGAPVIVLTFAATIAIATLTYRVIESPPIRLGHRLKAHSIRRAAGRNQVIA